MKKKDVLVIIAEDGAGEVEEYLGYVTDITEGKAAVRQIYGEDVACIDLEYVKLRTPSPTTVEAYAAESIESDEEPQTYRFKQVSSIHHLREVAALQRCVSFNVDILQELVDGHWVNRRAIESQLGGSNLAREIAKVVYNLHSGAFADEVGFKSEETRGGNIIYTYSDTPKEKIVTIFDVDGWGWMAAVNLETPRHFRLSQVEVSR